jgi:DNA-binding transcriptional LysR family regulator
MARFSHSYPAVELTVICEPSVDLLERIDANEIDLAIVTNCEQAHLGNFPSRAVALGDVESPLDSFGGTHAARPRTAELHLAAHRHRTA